MQYDEFFLEHTKCHEKVIFLSINNINTENTMKKLSLSILVLAAAFFMGCSDDTVATSPKTGGQSGSIEVAEINMAVYTKLTATWCGPCGDWGWGLSKEINEAIEGTAIGLGVYGSASSKMTNSTAVAFYSDFGGRGYPNFALNGSNLTEYSEAGGIFTTTTKTNVVDAAMEFASLPVQIGIGGNATMVDGILNVDLAVKPFVGQEGEFYVAAYVVEDKVMETQSGLSGIVEHHNVLRGSMNGETYGTAFTGGLTAGTQTNLETMDYGVDPEGNLDNITDVAVVWKKEGDKYTFVNSTHIQ